MNITKQNDVLWAKVIKVRAGGQCESCQATQYLQAHHIIERTNWYLRWSLDNGICLCDECHAKAHQNEVEFIGWLVSSGVRKRGLITELYARAKVRNRDNYLWRITTNDYLKETIDRYEKDIKVSHQT